MPAGDVPQLVRDHTLHFLGRVGGVDQSRMDIDDLPTRHEGVDGRIIDQHDVDILGLEPGGLDQRGRNLVEEGLGLGIAQDRLRSDRLGHEHGRCEDGEQAGKKAHRGELSRLPAEPELKPWSPCVRKR